MIGVFVFCGIFIDSAKISKLWMKILSARRMILIDVSLCMNLQNSFKPDTLFQIWSYMSYDSGGTVLQSQPARSCGIRREESRISWLVFFLANGEQRQ